MKDALDLLERLVDAVTQSGPDAADLDIDWQEFPGVVHDAERLLYEHGRRLP